MKTTFLIVRTFLFLVIVMEIKAQKKLVGYWGDNSSRGEKELKYYCNLNVYDTIIISQLTKNDKGTNKGWKKIVTIDFLVTIFVRKFVILFSSRRITLVSLLF